VVLDMGVGSGDVHVVGRVLGLWIDMDGTCGGLLLTFSSSDLCSAECVA
jgi:hypothetical protein